MLIRNPNELIAEIVIPATVGGFVVREVDLFDENGNLIAVGNHQHPAQTYQLYEHSSAADGHAGDGAGMPRALGNCQPPSPPEDTHPPESSPRSESEQIGSDQTHATNPPSPSTYGAASRDLGMTENLHVFFKDWGKPAHALRAGREVAAFTAIYDNPDLMGAVGSIQINARDRLLLCIESEVAELVENDEVEIGGESFFLMDDHPDGTGMTTLVVAPVLRET